MAKKILKGVTDAIARTMEAAQRMGWECQRTKNRHIKLVKPGHRPVFCSSTSSCHRAHLNAMKELRKAERDALLEKNLSGESLTG